MLEFCVCVRSQPDELVLCRLCEQQVLRSSLQLHTAVCKATHKAKSDDEAVNKEVRDLQKAIDGDTGPAMIGVASYPYSATQKNYLDDFEMLVASTITHPYIGSTCFNKGSAPHNLLTGAQQPQSPAVWRPPSGWL